MAKPVLPRVQAMVVCDAIKESDDEGGVYHLSGVRSALIVPSFPALRPRLSVLAQISGHSGTVSLRILVNRVENDETVFESRAKEYLFHDPMTVVTGVFRLRNCVFPAPGVYYVQLFHESKLIGERPLTVRLEE